MITSCPIYKASIDTPEAIAIIENGQSISYHQLHQKIQCIQVPDCKKLGLLQSKPSATMIALIFACIRQNVIPCILNPKQNQSTLNAQLSLINCQTIWQDPSLTLCLNAKPFNFDSEVSPPHQTKTKIDPEQIASIIFSSGTSGQAKAIAHVYQNHIYSALGSQDIIPIKQSEIWGLSLPLYHVSGLSILFRCFLHSATVLIPENKILDSLKQYPITHLSLVLPQLQSLLGDDYPTQNLQYILLGGSAIPKRIKEDAIQKKLPIYFSYGMSEMGSQICTAKVTDNLNCSGTLLPYRELMISNDNEIWVKGPCLFAGYVQNDTLYKPLTDEGWFQTGDMGCLDSKTKTLTVIGRKDSMFISGAENLYPEEIESAVLNIEGIKACIVLAIENLKYGHRPIAFIANPNQIPEQRIKNQLKNSLLQYKIPDQLYPWPDHIPKDKAARPLLMKHYESIKSSVNQ